LSTFEKRKIKIQSTSLLPRDQIEVETKEKTIGKGGVIQIHCLCRQHIYYVEKYFSVKVPGMSSNTQAVKHGLSVCFALQRSADAPVKTSPCKGLCLNAVRLNVYLIQKIILI